MIRFASLGSGSKGNALLVETGTTMILVDCGFSQQQIAKRMARLGRKPADLSAIVVTHEHGDHIGCAAALSTRLKIPAYMTSGTRAAVGRRSLGQFRRIVAEESFSVQDLRIEPFTVPHDAREPVQFVFSDGQYRLGLLTDLGHISAHVVQALQGVDALLVECNHDPDLLENGPYPPALKARVGGPYGHLPNAAATQLLKAIDTRRLQHVAGMHLSERNNRPELAQQALAAGLSCNPEETVIASQEGGLGWRIVG